MKWRTPWFILWPVYTLLSPVQTTTVQTTIVQTTIKTEAVKWPLRPLNGASATDGYNPPIRQYSTASGTED